MASIEASENSLLNSVLEILSHPPPSKLSFYFRADAQALEMGKVSNGGRVMTYEKGSILKEIIF